MSRGPWLIVPGVDPSIWSYRVRAGRQSAGRAADCDVHLFDSTVSRLHAEIRRHASGLCIRDLNSRNGTFVNGIHVIESPFQTGDSLRLGRVTLDVVADPVAVPRSSAHDDSGYHTPSPHLRRNDPGAKVFNVAGISDSQLPVLRLLLEGLSEKRVAEKLHLSPQTIHTHAKQIYKTLGVHSRPELMALLAHATADLPVWDPKDGGARTAAMQVLSDVP